MRALRSFLQSQELRHHPSLFPAFCVPREIFLVVISHAATLAHLGCLPQQMPSSDMSLLCCHLISDAAD